MHTYATIENNPIYKGMPTFTKDFHPFKEDFPLCGSLLLKIATIPMGEIIYAGSAKNGRPVRQYEFQLYGSVRDGWGIMHLFIKDKNHFFKHQPAYKILHDGEVQKIPLTYETMSNMTQEELSTIFWDFD